MQDETINVKKDRGERQTLDELLSLYIMKRKVSEKNRRIIDNLYKIVDEDANKWSEVEGTIKKLEKELSEIDEKNCLSRLKVKNSAYLDQEEYYIKLHCHLFCIMLWRMARPGHKVRVNYEFHDVPPTVLTMAHSMSAANFLHYIAKNFDRKFLELDENKFSKYYLDLYRSYRSSMPKVTDSYGFPLPQYEFNMTKEAEALIRFWALVKFLCLPKWEEKVQRYQEEIYKNLQTLHDLLSDLIAKFLTDLNQTKLLQQLSRFGASLGAMGATEAAFLSIMSARLSAWDTQLLPR